MLTLITGGSRSGKSSHALAIAAANPAPRKYFIATAEALDEEMARRIKHHRRARGDEYETIEEPRNLRSAVTSMAGKADLLVLDCLTLWVSNLMGDGLSDDAILGEADGLAEMLRALPCPTIVVTDEVGWGIVPDNEASRRFRDLLGWANQRVARAADQVILMAAGYPLRLK